MKKIQLFIILLVFFISIPNSLFAKKSISAGIGLNFTEEAFVLQIRSQLSPNFFFKIKFEKRYLNFTLFHQLKISFLAWPFFLKYNRPHYTDKTFTLNVPFEYELLFKIPPKKRVAFLAGTGLRFNVRWDRYSLGRLYWFSDVRILPLFFGVIGIDLKIFNRFEIIYKYSISGIVSFLFCYSMDEYIRTQKNLYCGNKNNLEFIVKFKKWYRMFIGWSNEIIFYFPLDGIFTTSYFLNDFYLGFEYAF